MDIDEALDFVNKLISDKTGKPLNESEIKVFKGAWQGLTYTAIDSLSAEYLEKDVGFKLWRKLTEVLGTKVTKKTFRGVVEGKIREQRSHSAAVPQPQDPAAEETAPQNLDFVEREEAIAEPSPENELDELENELHELIKAIRPDQPLETMLLWNFDDTRIVARTLANWQKLVSRHIAEECWRGFFWQVVRSEKIADELLLQSKKTIDSLVEADKCYQKFLTCIAEKSRDFQNSSQTRYKPAAIRAYYITLYSEIVTDISLAIFIESECPSDPTSGAPVLRDLFNSALFKFGRDSSLLLDTALAQTLNLLYRPLEYTTDPISWVMKLDVMIQHLSNAALKLQQLDKEEFINKLRERMQEIPHELQNAMQQRKLLQQAQQKPQLMQSVEAQIPDVDKCKKIFLEWWQSKQGQYWAGKFKAVMKNYRKLGYSLLFNEEQKRHFRYYYYANQWLVDCLNGGCNVSKDMRSHIEDTLLLPIDEIREIERQRGIK